MEVLERIQERPLAVENGHPVSLIDPHIRNTEEASARDRDYLVTRPSHHPGPPPAPAFGSARRRVGPRRRREGNRCRDLLRQSPVLEGGPVAMADGVTSAMPMANGWALGSRVTGSLTAYTPFFSLVTSALADRR